jgi:hypothetical protein
VTYTSESVTYPVCQQNVEISLYGASARRRITRAVEDS